MTLPVLAVVAVTTYDLLLSMHTDGRAVRSPVPSQGQASASE